MRINTLRSEFRIGRTERQLLKHVNEFCRVEREIEAVVRRNVVPIKPKPNFDWSLFHAYMEKFRSAKGQDWNQPFQRFSSNLAQKPWNPRAIKAIGLASMYFTFVAKAKTVKEKKERIAWLAKLTGDYIHQFNVTLNGSFNFIPAYKVRYVGAPVGHGEYKDPGWELPQAEHFDAWIWFSISRFGRKLAISPKRLKFCQYCKKFFWDGSTKSGSMRICQKTQCKKLWDAARSKESYNKKKKTRSAKARIKKSTSQKRRKGK